MKPIKIRILVFILAVGVGELLAGLLEQTVDPQARTTLSVASVNGGTAQTTSLRSYEVARHWVRPAVRGGYLVLAVILFVPKPKKFKK
jgi:hypothetical protein